MLERHTDSVSGTRRGFIDGWTWRLLLVQWALLLAEFTGIRLIFFLLYYPDYEFYPASQIALGFLAGVRFDLAVIMAVSGLPAMALLGLSRWRFRRWTLWVLAIPQGAIFLVLFVLQGIDLFYYDYAGHRVAFESFAVLGGWRPILAMMIDPYGSQTAIGLILLLAALAYGGWALNRASGCSYRPVPGWSQGLQVLGMFLLAVLLVRGGPQTEALNTGMAFRGESMALGHLSLNAPFTAAQAFQHRRRGLYRYYTDAEALQVTRRLVGLPEVPLDPRYPLMQQRANAPSTGSRKNVVILAMESFSPQFTGVLGHRPDLSPRFDALAADGLLFSEYYTTGTRSIEGIASMLTGYPALPNVTLRPGVLAQSKIRGLPEILKEAGYGTVFVYAANRGARGIGDFAARLGFERFISREGISQAEDRSGGVWGIHDEFSLRRLHEALERSPKPMLAFYLSLSFHAPYSLPDERFRVFGPEVPNADRLNSIRYADYSLGRFFDWARASRYWRNTVFVVTGDHNFGKGRMDRRSRMRVPLLILDPGSSEFPAGRVNETVGSHMDLPPTLLDMIGVSATQAFLGHSLLRPALHRYVLFAWGGVAGWLTRSSLLLHDLSKPLALYAYRDDPHLSRNLLRDGATEAGHPEIRQFQSFLQTTNNLLLRGRVFPSR